MASYFLRQLYRIFGGPGIWPASPPRVHENRPDRYCCRFRPVRPNLAFASDDPRLAPGIAVLLMRGEVSWVRRRDFMSGAGPTPNRDRLAVLLRDAASALDPDGAAELIAGVLAAPPEIG